MYVIKVKTRSVSLSRLWLKYKQSLSYIDSSLVYLLSCLVLGHGPGDKQAMKKEMRLILMRRCNMCC